MYYKYTFNMDHTFLSFFLSRSFGLVCSFLFSFCCWGVLYRSILVFFNKLLRIIILVLNKSMFVLYKYIREVLFDLLYQTNVLHKYLILEEGHFEFSSFWGRSFFKRKECSICSVCIGKWKEAGWCLLR